MQIKKDCNTKSFCKLFKIFICVDCRKIKGFFEKLKKSYFKINNR